MITYVDFSLFESPAKVLVNTVNTVGVMGKGIAKEFKRIYLEMFRDYQGLCEHRSFEIGDLWLYKTPHKWILNFPTKKHWRSPSKPEYIRAGLEKFADYFQDMRITSISFPLLGCGNGELDWTTQVKPLMEEFLTELPVDIFIHLPPEKVTNVPEHRDPKATKLWLRSEPQSLGFVEVWEDIVGVIGDRQRLLTFENCDEFWAEPLITNGGKAIAFKQGGKTIVVMERDQLLDLWQQIRDTGLCKPRTMPRGLDQNSTYLLPLLAELDYLIPIRQSEREDLVDENVGLLLMVDPVKSIRKIDSDGTARQLSLRLI